MKKKYVLDERNVINQKTIKKLGFNFYRISI